MGDQAMGDILAFRKMITPLVIEIVFWILVVLTVIGGLVTLFSGHGISSVVTGLLTIFLGPLALRIWCEIIIVLFRIYDVLRDIRDKGKM